MKSSGCYGGVSEIQQILTENGGPQLFNGSTWMPGFLSDLKCYSFSHSNQQMSLPTQFTQFQSLPFTQQLFQQSPLHQFQLLDSHQHQQHYASNSSGFMQPASMNFKLAKNGNILHSDDGEVGLSESDIHLYEQNWQIVTSTSVEDVPWRPLDIDCINYNKGCKDYITQDQLYTSIAKLYNNDYKIASIGGDNNFKVFSELEAIYKPSNNSSSNSGSGLTANDLSLISGVPTTTPLVAISTEKMLIVRQRKKRKRQQITSSVVAFFESLINQLVNNQETFERKFKELVDKKDQERESREAAWQEEREANSKRQSSSLSEHQALAASREATIITFVEKIVRNDVLQ